MLFNNKQQVVTLSHSAKMICAEGFADLTKGLSNTPSIRARQEILSPLTEKLHQSDPCGRSTGGMFSLETRANSFLLLSQVPCKTLSHLLFAIDHDQSDDYLTGLLFGRLLRRRNVLSRNQS